MIQEGKQGDMLASQTKSAALFAPEDNNIEKWEKENTILEETTYAMHQQWR